MQKFDYNYCRYTTKLKKVIDLCLINHDSILDVFLNLEKSNHRTLLRWIKRDKENRYQVVERMLGRHVIETNLDRATVKSMLRFP